MEPRSIILKSGLYVTATPIGNLGDMTYRAVETMKAADLILCEDTRQTAKLCSAYGIETPRSPYHDHNAARVRPGIITKMQDGAAICLVSDAGTPLISDPGYKLVREARDAGLDVFPVPGANAAITALCAAGAPSDQFFFAGFPPSKSGAREQVFNSLSTVPGVIAFYETGPRLGDSLIAMAKAFGDRQAVVARELTKLHEEFREGILMELGQSYKDQPPKGEIVILVFPAENRPVDDKDINDYLQNALEEMSVKDAAAAAAQELGIAKKTAYQRALAIKERR
ncbi:MAG: ribosomal RNA small subunit methyltransferase I [Hyphococcus sp.]|nr:MAG: ribosomal RNA small subunit methyltransferase I [Marinicaulis sp.]